MQDSFGKKIGRVCLYTLGSILALVAVIVALMPESESSRQNIELETAGLPATAVIIAMTKTREETDTHHHVRRRSGRSNGVATATRLVVATDRAMSESPNPTKLIDVYHVDYVFLTQGWELTDGSLKVAAQDFAALKVGAVVPLIYHPANASVSRLPDHSDPTIDPGPGARNLMVVIITISAAWFLGYGWWLSRKIVPAVAWHAEAERTTERVVRGAATPKQTLSARTMSPRSLAPARWQQGFGQRARA